MLLSTSERKKFIEWLEFTIETSEGIIKQMEKMPESNIDIIIERKKIITITLVRLILLKELKETEFIPIGD